MLRDNQTSAVSVSQLAYAGLFVSDRPAWMQFLEDLLGLRCVLETPGFSQFRLDDRAQRLLLIPQEADNLAFMGWETADREAMEAIAAQAEIAGAFVSTGTEGEAGMRGVREFIWFVDPDGVRIEVFHGASVTSQPFVSPLGVNFVAGALGFGHAALRVKDREASVLFYQRVLGCRLSDHIIWELNGIERHLTFLHVNPRHHSLALLDGLPDELDLAVCPVLHLMIQVSSLDEVGYAHDRVQSSGLWHSSIGKHTNDRTISFYVRTPSGFSIEYGYGGRELSLDQAEPVVVYDKTELWGHVRPT